MWNPQKKDFLSHHATIKSLVWLLAFLPANTWTFIRLIGCVFIYACGRDFTALLICLLLLALTDCIDGLVARGIKLFDWQHSWKFLDPFWHLKRWGWISLATADKAGHWLDPLADKIFFIGTMAWLGLVLLQPFLIWQVFLLVVVVELLGRIVAGLAHHFRSRNFVWEIKANYFGKIKFTLEMITGCLLVCVGFLLDDWLAMFIMFVVINIWLLPSVILLSIASTLGHIFIKKYTAWGLYEK